MPKRRRGNKKKERLQVAASNSLPARVPTRWVKFVVGLFLLPPAWVMTETFFTVFTRATLHEQFWATEAFWFFGLGVLLWLIIFFGLPKPLWLYVFGHELTHAIWVLLMGGRVHRFHVSRDGGHVLADKTNTWIALAPYFFPIYSVILILIYGLAGLLIDVTPYSRWLYGLIGATWAFHFSFTCWMIPKGQTDLNYGGNFFSLVVIYVLNLVLLAAMLIIASPGVTWVGFGGDFLRNAAEFNNQIQWLLQKLLRA